MAVFKVTPHKIGQLACRAKHAIGSLDRGIRTFGKVYHAVSHNVPEGRLKQAAERGLSSYEAIREKVRQGADMP